MIKSGLVREVVVTRLNRLGEERYHTALHFSIWMVQSTIMGIDAPINSPLAGLTFLVSALKIWVSVHSSRIRHGMEYSRQQSKANSNARLATKELMINYCRTKCWYIARHKRWYIQKLWRFAALASLARFWEQHRLNGQYPGGWLAHDPIWEDTCLPPLA